MNRIFLAATVALALAVPAVAAPLGTNTRAVLPAQIQQVISVDYRAMRNSSSGIALKERVMPDSLKQFERGLKGMGVNPDSDVAQLTFVAYRTAKGGIRTFGIANGEFEPKKFLARMKTRKVKPEKVRDTDVYPTGTGMVMTFLDEDTMLFGDSPSVRDALDVRDGEQRGVATNPEMSQMIADAEAGPVWSVLDQLGTQNMMKSALGQASSLTDYDVVKKRLLGSRYTLDMQRGVDFDLNVQTSDSFTAATLSSLLKAGMMYKRATGTPVEKNALDSMQVDSDSGRLVLKFKADDSKFQALLKSDLFTAVSK